ncbi:MULTISPECIES: PH domain-containing protein [Corynebacterium]|uniref:PH domain-containing protein n=1 Tax=Corynebacterium TaxID=1716 RepID=UPI00124D3AAA|nr:MULTISPECIES: PH domain-containing protein [Corynebacterium]MBV7280940.1 PH domain-containing protein [Corynebacterium sp. TAE3-ERU30]MBV7302666.1 PH domain-containing protein [Corynebacterium sp. TAE3-ERU2]
MTSSREENLQTYVSADAATTTDKPWELVVTSRMLRVISWASMAVVLAVHIFMAFVVAVGDTGAAVTPIDQWAFVGIGLVFVWLCWGIRRPRVRANADGVEVRNFIGTRFYPWQLIYGLSFPKKSPAARLELPDFEFVPMWAFFARDGEQVVRAVTDFRELESRYMPQD